MILRNALVASTFALCLLSGCGSQTINPGNNPNPASEGGLDGSGVTLQVSYQSQSVPVDLGTVATSSYKGVNLVKLSDVWTASQITADSTTLAFQFVGSDGFTPSSKGCADLPGTVLSQGYIDPSSRNITWDSALGFHGCYSVNDTVQMNAHVPAGNSEAGANDAASE